MECLYKGGGRAAWAEHLTRPYLLRSPIPAPAPGAGSADRGFALWILAADRDITAKERADLCEELVRNGCRYAVCSGFDCSLWDDAFDEAYLEATDHEPRDEDFLMTTWHEDETPEEVAAFFVNDTTFDDFVPRRFLLLCVGGKRADYVRACKGVVRELTR